ESNDRDSIISWDPHEDYLQELNLYRITYDILKYVDLCLPSQAEVMAMYGSKDLAAAARAFADAGPSVIAIKKSVEGSLVYVKETQQFFEIPIYPCRTVDPTEAGDSYCGGFLACYLKTKDPVLSACWGTVSASFVVEHVGALNTFESSFLEAEQRLEYVQSKVESF
ncbi:MAG: PfkB family carbohydrate kinase, partial [Anaerolineaceae bacterium]|nr:PfkB family carbohydrate kinase [Anaerolineaceae bacterium]